MTSVLPSAYAQLVRRTPLVAAAALPGVLLKLESLQRTGSFKLRGACTRLDALTAEERARGVVAASAGNHGLGVALAGKALGIRVEVVVPATSPEVKRRGIAALGASVVEGGPTYDDAEATARRRAGASGAVFVSPFDDPWVIAGNGRRLAEELLEQEPGLRTVICPVGGGGLCGGLAAALAPHGARVIGVQPVTNCAMHDSLRDGAALTVYSGAPTIAEGCDGAVAAATWELCRAAGVTIALVEEAAIREAVAFAYRQLGVVVEPTAAVGLAGLLRGVVKPAGKTALVITGGNVDPDLLDAVLAPRDPTGDPTAPVRSP